MAFVNPGAGNVLLPGPTTNVGATIALQTAFSKNPSRFSYLNAVRRIPTAKTVGVYAETNADDVARIVSGQEKPNWRDGAARPEPENIDHEIRTFQTQRNSEVAQLGNLTISNDQVGVVASHSSGKAHLAMLKKMLAFETLVTDPAILTQHYTATALGGGKVGSATSANSYIQKMFNGAKKAIQLNTNGAVGTSDIIAVMGVETASTIAESPETKDWLQSNPWAVNAFQGDDIFETYGLPPKLHGVRILVANESVVTSEKGAGTTTRRSLFEGLGTVSAQTVGTPIVFLTREGGARGKLQPFAEPLDAGDLNGMSTPVNTISNDTVLEIFHEDMTSETEVDNWNRVTKMAVTDNYVHKIGSVRGAVLVRDAV